MHMRNPFLLGAVLLLLPGGIVSAQIGNPPGQEGPASGQNYRDDRLQSDRNSAMVPTPARPPALPETTGKAEPRNSPDPNPLPGEEPRPVPR
jgi:hypothetical protein